MLMLLSTWFAYPWHLLALGAVVSLVPLFLWARRKRGEALATLALNSTCTPTGTRRRYEQALALCALTLLGLSAAGLQWGVGSEKSKTTTRDLVIVFDLSRSMDAEQPSRRERGVRLLRSLVTRLSERGETRVGMVLFAGRATLLFPLTLDYDHVAAALDRIELGDFFNLMAPQLNEAAQSGTRIGAGLRTAVEVFDSQSQVARDILLVSDGDDPAHDDEWQQGVDLARGRKIAVHVLAVGTPGRDFKIPFEKGYLEYRGSAVLTRLDEATLRDIARLTGGTYISEERSSELLKSPIEYFVGREAEDAVAEFSPVLEPRYRWPLGGALASLFLTMLPGQTIRQRAVRAVSTSAALAAMSASMGAEYFSDAQAMIRTGQAAFERQDYAGALACFDKAAPLTADPGRVAFDRGATLYRLQRYAEAAACYRQALDDQEIPAARQARAGYDLGNALIKECAGKSARMLEQALIAYRAALEVKVIDPELRRDLEHNLTLAQRLRASIASDASRNGDAEPKTGSTDTHPAPNDLPAKPVGDGAGDSKKARVGTEPGKSGSKKVQAGPLEVLPDEDTLVPLSLQETAARLERLAERVERERRTYRQALSHPAPGLKDW